MTYDDYLLALDELQTELKNVTVKQAVVSVLLRTDEANLLRLAEDKQKFKDAIKYSKNKAKIVNLQEFVNTKENIDKCRSLDYDIRIEQLTHQKNYTDATNMIKILNNKIKALKTLETEYGKVLHHDFRRDTGTITKR